jgi:PII-like signaling protein
LCGVSGGEAIVSLIGEQVLLRIYLQSADRAPRVPTWHRIVQVARKEKLAGATVLRGIMGAGRSGVIPGLGWSIAEHVPVIVEIVDEPEKIATFVQSLNEIMIGGMLTLERAAVMMYRYRDREELSNFELSATLKPLSTMPRIQPGNNMKTQENGVLIRVFIGESDKWEKKPLYEAIVQKTRELGLAGATVLRGSEGFGANSIVHKSALLEMSTDLPIVIEIVESEEKIKLLLPHLEAMVKEGMVTMEHVVVLMYRDGGDAVASA